MPANVKVITLLTDFGLKDPYVGVMKGVILSINPDARIVDITHNIEPQDVTEGCFLIKDYVPFFRKGTVHLCVVDPTVGSDRRPLVVAQEGHFFVGPDNGIFSLILNKQSRAWQITNKAYMLKQVSHTFHGRDVFAPVAAHLSLGLDPAVLGKEISDPVRLADIYPTKNGRVLTGRIVRFDRFGNAISNITAASLNAFHKGRPFRIEIAGLRFGRLNKTYSDKQRTCLEGSSGYIEFAAFKGNIARGKGIQKNDPVVVTLTRP